MNKKKLVWAAPGDINAFFGLMLDNVAGLFLMVSLLHGVFGFPLDVAMRYMVPGTAIGVLVGDLLFFFIALKMARQTGRRDVTAMPLGLDTPSTFGMIFMVLGPAFIGFKSTVASANPEFSPEEIAHAAAMSTWYVGIWCIVLSGLIKMFFSFFADWARKVFPRAGLLGSLAAIALVLISFMPVLEIFASPLVGMIALAIVLTTLIARVPLPFQIPGALAAVIVASFMHYTLMAIDSSFEEPLGLIPPAETLDAAKGLLPTEWTAAFSFAWLDHWQYAVEYLPVVIPFAIATVVGGIDCTESAAAAGDDYPTGQVVGVEALATLIAGLCGGVVQTTPYIGHPAYKAMGGRSAYTLATALFIGSAGLLGYFGFLYLFIPKVAILPILLFVGLEIGGQSFAATPKRHYTAVALACIPALASLGEILIVDGIMPNLGAKISDLSEKNQMNIMVIHMLNGGFIVTSLLWASALASMIDKNLLKSGIYFFVCALFTTFGIIHSPLDTNGMFLMPIFGFLVPENLQSFVLSDSKMVQTVWMWAGGYAMMGTFLLALHPTVDPAERINLPEDH